MEKIERRSILKAAMAAFPMAVLQQSLAISMPDDPHFVASGADRFGEHHKGAANGQPS